MRASEKQLQAQIDAFDINATVEDATAAARQLVHDRLGPTLQSLFKDTMTPDYLALLDTSSMASILPKIAEGLFDNPEEAASALQEQVNNWMQKVLTPADWGAYELARDSGFIEMAGIIPDEIKNRFISSLQENIDTIKTFTPEMQKQLVGVLSVMYSGDQLLTVVQQLGLDNALEYAKGLISGTPEVATAAQTLATEAQNNLTVVDDKSEETKTNLEGVQTKASETADQVGTDVSTANTTVDGLTTNVEDAGTTTKATMDEI